MKPAILRPLAETDIDKALREYLRKAPHVAEPFLDAVIEAREGLCTYPGAGSPRYGVELDIPGLSFWVVRGFPYLIFYLEHEDWIDVWRVLHQHRDIPAELQDHEP